MTNDNNKRYECSPKVKLSLDDNTIVVYNDSWRNKHGRFYSAKSLYNRIIKDIKEFWFRVYFIKNSKNINQEIYCRFFLIGTKKRRWYK